MAHPFPRLTITLGHYSLRALLSSLRHASLSLSLCVCAMSHDCVCLLLSYKHLSHNTVFGLLLLCCSSCTCPVGLYYTAVVWWCLCSALPNGTVYRTLRVRDPNSTTILVTSNDMASPSLNSSVLCVAANSRNCCSCTAST
jgi:hypothetical protein